LDLLVGSGGTSRARATSLTKRWVWRLARPPDPRAPGAQECAINVPFVWPKSGLVWSSPLGKLSA